MVLRSPSSVRTTRSRAQQSQQNLEDPNFSPLNDPTLQPILIDIEQEPQIPNMNNQAIMKLTEFLPVYDGSSTSDVEIFLQKIQLIVPQIPNAEVPFFLTLLKLKLSGAAAEFMAGENCPDIITFTTLLRDRFQLLRKPENYHAHLSQMHQYPKEKLSDYASRVMKILNKLNLALANETGVQLSPQVLNMNHRQGIKTFIDGLSNHELRTSLRLRDFNTIADAITTASEIKTRIDNTRNVRPIPNNSTPHNFSKTNSQHANNYSSTNNSNPNNNRTNYSQNNNKNCNYCKRVGHVEQDCRTKALGKPPPNNFIPNNNFGQNKNNAQFPQNNNNYYQNKTPNYNQSYNHVQNSQPPISQGNPNVPPNKPPPNKILTIHSEINNSQHTGNEQPQESMKQQNSCVQMN